MRVLKFSNYLLESTDMHLSYSAFDWDDNILHMPTTILMDKKSGNSWLPIEVSTSEFANIRNDKDNYRLRDDNPEIAFSGFRDTGPKGKSVFIEDVKKALNAKAYAPAWDHFIETLSNGTIFAIVTARGHEPDTIKMAVEYIIDNILDENQKFLLYSHCLKHIYLFNDKNVDSYDRIPKGQLSKSKLIQEYLDTCDFYGVSSKSFASEFGEASASNPEKAKEMALDKFVNKCNQYAKKIGAKSVSIGFSDDDPKNVDHVHKFFKEKSALTNELEHVFKLNVYKTTDRSIKGGERKKFVGGEEIKLESNLTPGLEGSILPFTKWNNMTSYNYPNSKDVPTDDQHHKLKMTTGQSTSLYKEFAFNRKSKKK